MPIGYHGRASSIVPSGTAVRRPCGQLKDAKADAPVFGPTRALDYEAEVGYVVGRGNALGAPVPIGDAEAHVFGMCLVNDWSARDVQTWEYQPLGPFLAKSFATTVSPWVVTMEALAPFRVPAAPRPAGDPAPLPYLAWPADEAAGGVNVAVEVYLVSARMRAENVAPMRVSRGRAADLYWTPAQMLAHHTSNGCNLRPGDLFASGTISGPTKDARGCLLELTWRGAEPLKFPTGETRAFLENGDEVILRGYAEREGAVRIGFGECRGMVVE
jgi:fumarylacetoacetase